MTDQHNPIISLSEQASAAIAKPMTADDMLAKFGLKVKSVVTRTVLQQIENQPFIVTIQSAAYEGQAIEKTKMQAARLCDVRNFETGALQLLIMNTVLEGELNRAYPDHGYVGKTFLISSYKPIKDGKPARYRVYQIAELDVTEDGEVSGDVVANAADPEHVPVNRAGEPVEEHEKHEKAKAGKKS